MTVPIRQLLASANPALSMGVGSFRRASAKVPATARGRIVALIGRRPGSGTSTVAAMLALTAAGYTSNRVAVIETNPTSRDGGRGVTELLGGTGDGALPALLDVPDGEAVARSRLRAASTPGAAVPVFALPPVTGRFAPQVLEQVLARLQYRSDLTIIDTPNDRGEPVFHAVLHLVDHVLLVLDTAAKAAERLAAMRRWLAATPGRPRRHDVSVVLVARTRFVPSWRPEDLPWVMIRTDRALRAGAPGRMSRASTISALQLLSAVSGPTSAG